MWYTKNNLRIAQNANALQEFKNLLKINGYATLSDYMTGVDGFDSKNEDKNFTFTFNNKNLTTSIQTIKNKQLLINENNDLNSNGQQQQQKQTFVGTPFQVDAKYTSILTQGPIQIANNMYQITTLDDDTFTGTQAQITNILENIFNDIKSKQANSGHFQTVTKNQGKPSQPGALVFPPLKNNKYLFPLSNEDIDNYNKLFDNKFEFKITAFPSQTNPKGHAVRVEFGNPPPGTEALVNKLKQYIENESIFTLPTDDKGNLIEFEYTSIADTKAEFTPAQFEKTFIEPLLPGVGIGDPIKLKIDGRDIKNVRNGENVILDPNDLYLTEGKHIIEFVSNNADKNLNADKSDFLSYQVNVTDGQKLSLIGSSRGSFPQLYNRGPLSTEKQRIEQRLKAQRKAPTQEAEEQTDKLNTALRTEASSFGLKNSVYNTAMQRYDFNEVQQYVEEIMRNRALYSTPQKRKEYADSLKRERGRVRTQTPADALLNPRPGA